MGFTDVEEIKDELEASGFAAFAEPGHGVEPDSVFVNWGHSNPADPGYDESYEGFR